MKEKLFIPIPVHAGRVGRKAISYQINWMTPDLRGRYRQRRQGEATTVVWHMHA